jgi:hypothetical protein
MCYAVNPYNARNRTFNHLAFKVNFAAEYQRLNFKLRPPSEVDLVIEGVPYVGFIDKGQCANPSPHPWIICNLSISNRLEAAIFARTKQKLLKITLEGVKYTSLIREGAL